MNQSTAAERMTCRVQAYDRRVLLSSGLQAHAMILDNAHACISRIRA